MSGEVFEPDECEVTENGERVKISFRRDNGTSRELGLPKSHLPQLVSQLIARIAPGSGAPIDRASLQIGQTFAVQGFHVRKNTDGRRLLTVSVALPDQGRVVTIPLELSPKDVVELIAMLRGEG